MTRRISWLALAFALLVGIVGFQRQPSALGGSGGFGCQSPGMNVSIGFCSGSAACTTGWCPNSTQATMVNQSYSTGATFSVTLDATPASTDVIVIALYNNQSQFAYMTGVTVNGSSATFLIDSAGNSTPTTGSSEALQFWQITGITTPSLTIATTSSAGGVQYEGITVGVLKGLTSSTPTAKGYGPSAGQADPQTLASAITVPSAGFGIVAMSTSASGTESPTSSNSTFDSTTNVGGFGQSVFNFHTAAAGSWNAAITGSPATSYNASLVAAAWH